MQNNESVSIIKTKKMQSLKVFYNDDTHTLPQMVKDVLEATGKFVVLIKTEKSKEDLTSGSIEFGHFTFNTKAKTLQWKQEEPQRITLREAEILSLLLANVGELVKRNMILSLFWKEHSFYTSRSLDLFIFRIRKMLKPDPSVILKTIRGEGFTLTY